MCERSEHWRVMPESFEREISDDSKAPRDSEGRAVYGKRNSNATIEARQRRLYRHQLDGLPARQLVYEHASRESVSLATAWRDWTQVCQWNDEGWEDEKKTILSRINSMRQNIIQRAIKKGQLQTAVMALKDLQETLPEMRESEDINLNITIEE